MQAVTRAKNFVIVAVLAVCSIDLFNLGQGETSFAVSLNLRLLILRLHDPAEEPLDRLLIVLLDDLHAVHPSAVLVGHSLEFQQVLEAPYSGTD